MEIKDIYKEQQNHYCLTHSEMCRVSVDTALICAMGKWITNTEQTTDIWSITIYRKSSNAHSE